MIMAADTTSEAKDMRQMLPMLEKVKKRLEKKPEKAAMDAGHYAKDKLEKAEKVETDRYATSGKWKKRGQEKGVQEKEGQR